VKVKGPKQSSFKPSDKKAKKAKGKKAGGGGEVDVNDPVLQMLEPVDDFPAAAFGVPSAIDSDGNRTVVVAMPTGASGDSLKIVIDDATRVIRTVELVHDSKTATFTLSDVGDPSIDAGE
jgi:hypothetical protein